MRLMTPPGEGQPRGDPKASAESEEILAENLLPNATPLGRGAVQEKQERQLFGGVCTPRGAALAAECGQA